VRIAIGTDHRGFAHKEFIKQNLPEITWSDVGCFSAERCDYPPFAKKVVELLQQRKVDVGILLCGSGIGMVIAANRFEGMRAGVVWNQEIAMMAKADDNVNILVLPADFVTQEDAVKCIKSWLQAKFKGGRYEERLAMIEKFV